jgi:hypothetical protein
MNERIELCLSAPEGHTAPGSERRLPEIVLEGTLQPRARLGCNTLLLAPGDLEVSAIHLQGPDGVWQPHVAPGFYFSADFISGEGHAHAERAFAELSARLGRPIVLGRLFPFVAIRRLADRASIYHLVDLGPRGSLYVRFAEGAADQSAAALVAGSEEAWHIARRSVNDACWYSKYRPEVEIEKKYTFPRPLDTWRLNYRLYRRILAGDLPGFVPEFNDEFQVWDFENHMFEVLSPPSQRGYISFIPQSNRSMTVKQKLFAEDQEVRVEKLTANLPLSLDQAADHARKLCGGEIRPLPPYRRKRFDVNLESLETGNVFGIFFDLCRPLGDAEEALFQCELEYLRSRTLGPITNVLAEYEVVARFTERFFDEEGVSYQKGHYSKLSYLKDYASRRRSDAA